MNNKEHAIAFGTWYSDMDKEKVERAYERYEREVLNKDIEQKPKSNCKGSWIIGNNCKRCPRCIRTKSIYITEENMFALVGRKFKDELGRVSVVDQATYNSDGIPLIIPVKQGIDIERGYNIRIAKLKLI
jgi:hypothetical protein